MLPTLAIFHICTRTQLCELLTLLELLQGINVLCCQLLWLFREHDVIERLLNSHGFFILDLDIGGLETFNFFALAGSLIFESFRLVFFVYHLLVVLLSLHVLLLF